MELRPGHGEDDAIIPVFSLTARLHIGNQLEGRMQRLRKVFAMGLLSGRLGAWVPWQCGG